MKLINGFSCYEIYEDGTIYGLFYPVKFGKKLRKNKHKLKPWKNKDGYGMVTLRSNEGKRFHKSVHRLVAENFIENPDQYPIVCHNDSDVNNNHFKNLRWGTIKDNIQDEIKRGTFRGYNLVVS